MAKYKTFDEYIKGERIVRYVKTFERCWNFSAQVAEEKFNSAMQGKVAIKYMEKLSKLWLDEHACESSILIALQEACNDYRSQISIPTLKTIETEEQRATGTGSPFVGDPAEPHDCP